MIAVCGGTAIIVGAALPWMSLFAGLQSYAGLAGLYGRLMFAGGVMAVAGGAAMGIGSRELLRHAVGTVGIAVACISLWSLLGLRTTIRELGTHPLLLARAGPGLFVVLTGALLVAAVLVPGRGSTTARAAPDRSPRP
jgi:hypothetical protein